MNEKYMLELEDVEKQETQRRDKMGSEDLAKDKSDQRTDRFAVGERVDAKVIRFDKESRRITLSIRALEIQEEKDAIKEYGSTTSGASLGDILGSALDSTAANDEKS